MLRALHVVHVCVAECLERHVRDDESGGHHVDPHAILGLAQRHAAAKVAQGSLSRSVSRDDCRGKAG